MTSHVLPDADRRLADVVAHATRTRSRSTGVSRRGFLRAGAGTAAVAATLGLVSRPAHAGMPRAIAAAGGAATDPKLTLVKRATQGFSLLDYALAHGLGYDGWLAYQINHTKIDDSAVNAMLAPLTTLTMTPQQLYDAVQNTSLTAGTIYRELTEATIVRSIHSPRQLYERMVEFWTNHFNIDWNDGAVRYMLPDFDAKVIRQHAMGYFPDMLKASAKHGAMLAYLDNNTNVVGRPQENYARELLELHTVGVDNGYTQTDVQELARALTGWTIENVRSGRLGDFRFNPRGHDTGPKTVMGFVVPANQPGTDDGDQIIDFLAKHPNTATFIATKLAKWFLGENPVPAAINAIAATYTATGGHIPSMLNVVLSQPAIATATPKMRQPRGQLTSMFRSTLGQLAIGTNRTSIVNELTLLGQLPHRWPTPDGFPDDIASWGKALHPRWNFASRYCLNQVRIATVDVVSLLPLVGAAAPGHQAWGMNLILTGGSMSEEEQYVVQDFIDVNNGTAATIRDAFGLAGSAPSAQLY